MSEKDKLLEHRIYTSALECVRKLILHNYIHLVGLLISTICNIVTPE